MYLGFFGASLALAFLAFSLNNCFSFFWRFMCFTRRVRVNFD
jgi:hypothetical protein